MQTIIWRFRHQVSKTRHEQKNTNFIANNFIDPNNKNIETLYWFLFHCQNKAGADDTNAVTHDLSHKKTNSFTNVNTFWTVKFGSILDTSEHFYHFFYFNRCESEIVQNFASRRPQKNIHNKNIRRKLLVWESCTIFPAFYLWWMYFSSSHTITWRRWIFHKKAFLQ